MNTFECDKNKAKSNYKKHGLRFTEACRMFSGHTLTAESHQNDKLSETRYLSIGCIDDGVTVVVVWVKRLNNLRVISVRKARDKEREQYYAYIKKTIS